jgi:hypothetical protein
MTAGVYIAGHNSWAVSVDPVMGHYASVEDALSDATSTPLSIGTDAARLSIEDSPQRRG